MSCHVVACARGVGQHAPDLGAGVKAAGGQFSMVECFDKCETCERVLLVRLNGAMMRCGSAEEVVLAMAALAEP